MKCLFLAAGYATRLYPLTKNFPKPLLKVGKQNILERLLDDLATADGPDLFYVVTNAKFASHFQEWSQTRAESIVVVDDGTDSNETRLGAVRDMLFAIESCGIDDDLLVLAGDNLLDFSLTEFLRYARMKKASCGVRYYEADETRLRRSGVAIVDESDRIVSMVEKPQEPQSHWCTPPFYFYRREDLPLVRTALEDGCNPDAPGSFLAWLADHVDVYSWLMPGRRYDIGTLDAYEEAKRLFGE